MPGLPGIRLHLADDILAVWGAAQPEFGGSGEGAGDLGPRRPDAPLPYWAAAWAGGLAIARYLAEHPEAVAGRRVLDLASGSGLCALAAARAGARSVVAIDVDPLAAAAIRLNARVAGVQVEVVDRDVLDQAPPPAEVVLAGDVCYEAGLAARVMPWLRAAGEGGATVLLGDPGRRYLPAADLLELARYEVRTTTELEDLERKKAAVYTMSPPCVSGSTLPASTHPAAQRT